MDETNLKNKAVKGVGWSFTDNMVQYLVGFIVSIILARLLSPSEYGLIGLITIFTSFSTTIINSGVYDALMREKNPTEEDYSTSFIINMALSVLLYVVLFACAPSISRFFDRPELISLTRVVSIGLVIGAFAIVQRVRLTKNIDFKKQTNVTFIAGCLSGCVGIIMAYSGFGVWALVFQQLTSQICISVLLCIFNRWMPRLRFSTGSFKRLFGFSWKLLIANIIDSLWGELYRIVIGKRYSAESLGYYTRARQYSDIFSSNIHQTITRVSYPVLSSIQDDNERLINVYRKIIKMTMLVCFVLTFGVAATAKPLILVLIGEKWLPCALMMQIICFNVVLFPLQNINLTMLKLQGKSDVFLMLSIIKKILALGPLFIGIFFDIYWMLIASVGLSVCEYCLNAYSSGKLINYGLIAQIKDILPSFCIALSMAVIAYVFNFLNLSPFVVLPIQVIVAALYVVVLCELLKREEYLEIKSIVLTALKKVLKH